MLIEIDKQSGFCFGVQKAIDKADELLDHKEDLYCLGDIVHNGLEVNRLTQKGITTISPENISNIENKTVLIRSHGEPPLSYALLKTNKNKIVDATCPVVLKLQQRIKKSFNEVSKRNGQLVILGKHGHPEVVGLNGQTNNQCIIISNISELNQLDFNRPIELYTQTTMPLTTFQEVKIELELKAKNALCIHDTVCRQVANRVPRLQEFSQKHDLIIFVGGKKSSNGKLLYEVCKKQNLNSYFISSVNEIESNWFSTIKSVGICGATSTPLWLLEKTKLHILTILNVD